MPTFIKIIIFLAILGVVADAFVAEGESVLPSEVVILFLGMLLMAGVMVLRLDGINLTVIGKLVVTMGIIVSVLYIAFIVT